MSGAAKGTFMHKLETKIMPFVYGYGAAIVILGAMFKIMHWPGAGLMLVVGLSTEAVIFFLSAHMEVPEDPDWTKVYPQLASDDEVDGSEVASSDNMAKKLSDMMSDAQINQETVSKLGAGLNNLSENAASLANLSDASVATTEYASNVKAASSKMSEMNTSFDTTLEAMSSMANAADGAQGYHEQVQEITKNLGALNAVYEMELGDANNHLKAMNKFYANLSTAMENLSDAGSDTETLRTEVNKLAGNLTSLNGVYGSMLTAMKG